MLQTNISFILTSIISSTDTTGDTFNISNDTELDAPINTAGNIVSIVLTTSRQRERMTVTILNNVCTIVKRWLSQVWGTEVSGLKKQWIEGASWYITAFDTDILDKDGETQNVSSAINFNGAINFANKMNIPVFASTGARDAVYTSPVDGDKCFINGVWEQNYNGGAWFTLGTSTPTPNASTTVAGKVEEATDAEVTAGTTTGGTGARLYASLAQLLKSILLKPTATSTTDSTYFGINQSGVDYKITQWNLRTQLAGSTTLKGTFEMATDAEAIAWTDTTRVVNVKQLQDKFDGIYDIRVPWFDSTQASFPAAFINFTSAYTQVLSTTPAEWVYALSISDTYLSVSEVTAVRIKKNGTTIIEYLYNDIKTVFGWQGYKDNGFVYPITCDGTDVITVEQTRWGATWFGYATDVHVRYSLLNTN